MKEVGHGGQDAQEALVLLVESALVLVEHPKTPSALAVVAAQRHGQDRARLVARDAVEVLDEAACRGRRSGCSLAEPVLATKRRCLGPAGCAGPSPPCRARSSSKARLVGVDEEDGAAVGAEDVADLLGDDHQERVEPRLDGDQAPERARRVWRFSSS